MADKTIGANGITYAEIAKKYGLKLETLRVYAATDENFPKPVNDNRKERRFDNAEVDQWFAARAQRKGPGRPNSGATPRIATSETEIKKLRNLMKAHGIAVQDLGAIIGANREVVGSRLQGRSRWTVKELEAIEEHASLNGLKTLQNWAARHSKKAQ